jgi:hypothetical protein
MLFGLSSDTLLAWSHPYLTRFIERYPAAIRDFHSVATSGIVNPAIAARGLTPTSWPGVTRDVQLATLTSASVETVRSNAKKYNSGSR